MRSESSDDDGINAASSTRTDETFVGRRTSAARRAESAGTRRLTRTTSVFLTSLCPTGQPCIVRSEKKKENRKMHWKMSARRPTTAGRRESAPKACPEIWKIVLKENAPRESGTRKIWKIVLKENAMWKISSGKYRQAENVVVSPPIRTRAKYPSRESPA